MGGSERDLVLALRSELAAIDPARACDRVAEVAGLAVEAGRQTRALIREVPIARLVLRLARDRPDRATAAGPAGTRHDSMDASAGRPAAVVLEPGSGEGVVDSSVARFDWDASPEHCRLAWLRGLFLAHGSLSLAGGRTHLEFVVGPADAPILASRLASVELPASWRIRRGRGVVTWKNGDVVGLFLRRVGANAVLLEVEVRQVSRALRGDLNRVLNAESANLQRAVGAAGRQVAAIEDLIASGELNEQTYVVRVVAEARRETPEATLAELAERLGVHRSAVQRALERIERLALWPDDGDHRPGRRRASRSVGDVDRRRAGGRPGAPRSVAAIAPEAPGSARPLA
jgi:AraC-like DNA-binding protein